MPRQTFLSRESFVDATERQTKETLFSIPAYVSHIRMVAENKVIESYKFHYEQAHKNIHYVIDVSILPLNDQYTRISLHSQSQKTPTREQTKTSVRGMNIQERRTLKRKMKLGQRSRMGKTRRRCAQVRYSGN